MRELQNSFLRLNNLIYYFSSNLRQKDALYTDKVQIWKSFVSVSSEYNIFGICKILIPLREEWI